VADVATGIDMLLEAIAAPDSPTRQPKRPEQGLGLGGHNHDISSDASTDAAIDLSKDGTKPQSH
jgi:hypothetical protein